MKIYLDYIFLENIVVNVIIYLETIKLIKVRTKVSKIILFSTLNSVITCLCLFLTLNNCFIVEFLVTGLSLYFFIHENNVIKVIKAELIYYLIYFIFLGITFFIALVLGCNLDYIAIKIGVYIFSGIILNILVNILWEMWKIKITDNSLFYILCINNVKILAFVDTGNTVKDPITNLDVIFIDKKYKEKILENNKECRKVNIIVQSINGESIVDGFVIKNVEIWNNERKIAKIDKIIISFNLSNTQEKYSGIIGYDTYLEYLEGVEL